MNIGEAAAASGLPAKTIRYYEEIGLIRPKRDGNGYRAFAEDDVHRLAFLNRSRGLGFSIEDCRALLGLYADDTRASEDVKRLAADHLTRIDARISELQALRATVAGLVDACAGDGRPDCPILEDLATGPLCAHQRPKPLA
ncbi:Cu(I)-responsive transcriptional regulator [Pararhodobacter zhoushanensis]|uniref:Cu(I)-responsive transcriptional regulator n=1 Tax=Pararhodobacter zhoushanensis TaxID=2479545 RepID=UPI000F8DEA4A|nr:Cu(I)-responsive transcriptional regulator [Pararhodobacter zhoushanensis]